MSCQEFFHEKAQDVVVQGFLRSNENSDKEDRHRGKDEVVPAVVDKSGYSGEDCDSLALPSLEQLDSIDVCVAKDAHVLCELYVFVSLTVTAQKLHNFGPVVRAMLLHECCLEQIFCEDFRLEYPRLSEGSQLIVVVQIPCTTEEKSRERNVLSFFKEM